MNVTAKTLKTGLPFHLAGSRWAVSGQPGPEDLREFKEEGFHRIVNVRGPGELEKLNFSPTKTAESLSLSYKNIPIMKNGALDRTALDQTHQALCAFDKTDGKILIHCAKGQRAVAVLLNHLLRLKKISGDLAPSLALKLGLRNENLMAELLQTLEEENKRRS